VKTSEACAENNYWIALPRRLG